MNGAPQAGDGEDPRVATLLGVNAELAAEVRRLERDGVGHARSAASPSARRLGRFVAEHDALVVERDRLAEELNRLGAELAERDAGLQAVTDRAEKLERERVRLVEKVAEYGELAEALKAEVDRLRGGPLGVLRRGLARVTPARRRFGGTPGR